MSEFDQLHAHMSRLADEMRRVAMGVFGSSTQWRPAVNAYRLADRYLVCVDLAGMNRDAISVRAEASRLVISGTRPAPEPPRDEGSPAQTLAMEIDYGPFRRVLELPDAVDAGRVTANYRSGFLWIQMPLLPRPETVIGVAEDES
jgi:HSP20 family protein